MTNHTYVRMSCPLKQRSSTRLHTDQSRNLFKIRTATWNDNPKSLALNIDYIKRLTSNYYHKQTTEYCSFDPVLHPPSRCTPQFRWYSSSWLSSCNNHFQHGRCIFPWSWTLFVNLLWCRCDGTHRGLLEYAVNDAEIYCEDPTRLFHSDLWSTLTLPFPPSYLVTCFSNTPQFTERTATNTSRVVKLHLENVWHDYLEKFYQALQ